MEEQRTERIMKKTLPTFSQGLKDELSLRLPWAMESLLEVQRQLLLERGGGASGSESPLFWT